MEYLREDGIVLPADDSDAEATWSDKDSGVYSVDKEESDDDDGFLDPSSHFLELHNKIKETIAELGGKVTPKLNWSAPKDATWIAATNSMECNTASDVYLLLKSSDFITHDLQHAFDGCIDELSSPTDGESSLPETSISLRDIPYHLVLRKYLNMNPSLEFRCFVRDRKIIGITQRDPNHFEFLFPMVDSLRSRTQAFFDEKLKKTFPDPNFVFDVYIPPPHKRVWLIDVNPWAPRTDPILFSWLELLELEVPMESGSASPRPSISEKSQGGEDSEAEKELPFVPEFRLIHRDDPEAFCFNTPQYSAHKLPRDVVDASKEGYGGIREFADQWKEIIRQQEVEEREKGEEVGG